MRLFCSFNCREESSVLLLGGGFKDFLMVVIRPKKRMRATRKATMRGTISAKPFMIVDYRRKIRVRQPDFSLIFFDKSHEKTSGIIGLWYLLYCEVYGLLI